MPMPMRQSSLRFGPELCAVSVWCNDTSPGSRSKVHGIVFADDVGELLAARQHRERVVVIIEMGELAVVMGARDDAHAAALRAATASGRPRR